MASLNKKATDDRFSLEDARLAGGSGLVPAKQDAESLLRRCIMTCLLWENNAYVSGKSVSENIAKLIPQVSPDVVASLAVEARFTQKLRHVPLFICREMLRHDQHKMLVADTLSKVIHRPDEMAEFLSLYWADNGNIKSIASQARRGLAKAFSKFNEHQLQKYNRNKEVKLRDVLRLCHPKPRDESQSQLWRRLIQNNLDTPDTWEVNLSKAKSIKEKRGVWTRLLTENKLGATAFLKNLRNMIDVNVDKNLIANSLLSLNTSMLAPIDFVKAVQFAPMFIREIEAAMLKCLAGQSKLDGHTVLVLDVSGSMRIQLSPKSVFSRLDAAIGMAIIASELCDRISIYITAGSDSIYYGGHATKLITPYRGFALQKEILNNLRSVGTGGIYTRQCLEYIEKETGYVDRIIVFSDSQDCDRIKKVPKPFGKHNYIIDVSPHQNGINYRGVWDAEICGWSEHFLKFIYEYEHSSY